MSWKPYLATLIEDTRQRIINPRLTPIGRLLRPVSSQANEQSCESGNSGFGKMGTRGSRFGQVGLRQMRLGQLAWGFPSSYSSLIWTGPCFNHVKTLPHPNHELIQPDVPGYRPEHIATLSVASQRRTILILKEK